MKNKFLKLKNFLNEVYLLRLVADKKTFWKFIWAILISIPTNIKKLNVNAAFDRMIGQKCIFNASKWGWGEIKVIFDGKWFGYAINSYVRPDYFLPPHFVLKKGMTVVDLGATAGDFTILAALICDKVIAIEAKESDLEELKKNAELNKCSDKIITIHGIVGPASGSVIKEESMKNYLKIYPAPTISMNEVFSRHSLNKVNFLKIDIEGSEFDLFSHDTEWLSKVDKIAMEVHGQCGDVNKLRTDLEYFGFEVVLTDLDKKNTTEIGKKNGYLYAKRF